jgi:hypothetical protein
MSEQLALTLSAASVGLVSAVFFCIGNASNSVDKISLQSTPFWDFSEPVARALASQRAQYIIGGLLLLASFSLQVAAALASSTTLAALPQFLQFWPCLVLSVIAATGLLSGLACVCLDRSTINKVLRKHQANLAAQEQKTQSVST